MRLCKYGCDVLDSPELLEKCFIKAIEYFSVFIQLHPKHLGTGRILCLELSKSPSCLEKVISNAEMLYCLIRTNLVMQ